MQRRLIHILVFVSGLSGLIYQVVWHRYLSILLGAQARATAIILAVFLGGISLGYFLFGRLSRKKGQNLMLTFSLIEIGMAFWGFIFPHLFKASMPLTGLMYQHVGVSNLLTDFVISILMIGVPTILMGGTLPLLTQAFSTSVSDASKTHAGIYAWNTIGACFGCLLAGYVLIPTVGLALSSTIAAAGNIWVSLFSFYVFARKFLTPQVVQEPDQYKNIPFTKRQLGLLCIGLFSGFCTITLESIVIRLMNLSSGASQYNFTLVVAVFILGLGFSSLATSQINHFKIGRLVVNQIATAILLMALYFSANYWSYGAHLVRASFRDSIENFYVYQFALGIFYAALLIVPIGLAGFTLPLCFHFLKDDPKSLGHRVGQLYSINTLGCVLGALVGGYFLLHWFNLDQIFKFCVLLTVAGGLVAIALAREEEKWTSLRYGISIAVLLAVTFGISRAPLLDRRRFTQPFRHQDPVENVTYSGPEAFGAFLSRSTEYVLFKDGPNTSVGIGISRDQGKESSRSIFVNGKSDGNTLGDRLTTVLLGHIPALLAEKIERVCVIGFGTGMTIGTLGLYDEVKTIDVAEISSTIIENHKEFDAYNHGVSTNPKVRFHEMDAFRWLGGTREKYDIIVSEPSNPWVMGIENLYSDEFYGIAKDRLNENGMFVQWIHTYSFNDLLFKIVLASLNHNFTNISVFQLRGGDLALVASKRPIVSSDFVRAVLRFSSPNVKADLLASGIETLETVLGYEIIPDGVVSALAAEAGGIHRLENPMLSNAAAKAFFSQQSSEILRTRKNVKEFYLATTQNSLLAKYLPPNVPYSKEQTDKLLSAYCRHSTASNRILCEEISIAAAMSGQYKGDVYVNEEGRLLINYLTQKRSAKFDANDLREFSINFDRFKQIYSPLARLPHHALAAELDRCLKIVPRENEVHGDCMLQRIVLTESFLPLNISGEWITRYLDWFSSLAATSPSYERFKSAGEIVRRIASLKEPKAK